MGYFFINDDVIDLLGFEAGWLYTAGAAYCVRERTPRIPKSAISRFGHGDQVDRLVEMGLWFDAVDDFFVPDCGFFLTEEAAAAKGIF